MRSLLLTCLIAFSSVETIIASPVPDASSESGVEFPIPLNDNGITTDFISFGGYPSPPPKILGGGNNIIASQAAESVLLGDDSHQDLSTAWGEDLAAPTTPQSSDTTLFSSQQLMFDSTNGYLPAQAANFADQISSSPTQTPFQIYKDAECGGTKSVCCSGIGIDTSYQPGVPLPCSDSMKIFFPSSPSFL